MDTRKEDYKIIEKGLRSSNPVDRRQAEMAKERIKAESKDTKHLREALVNAHRSGNRGKIDEIGRKLHGENKRIQKKVETYYRRRYE